jgi:MFS family permease
MDRFKRAGFSQNVVVLSFVSLLNDIGGETIKKAIPLFLTNVLGVSASIIGLVEGVTESTPQLFQPLSGYISDRFKKRKPLVVFGQMLRSLMLFLFWAGSWPTVLFWRFLDRSGKGVAQAPRDALIAGSSEASHVGRSFGLNRMFDNGGAVIGLVLAGIITLSLGHGSLLMTQQIFGWIVLLAVIPLVVSVFLVAFGVHDVPIRPVAQKIVLHDHLGRKFYLFLFFSFLFTLGNSSDAFLVLKSQHIGFNLWQIFFLLALYSLVSSLSGLPLSSLSDRIGRKKLLVTGWFLYSVIYLFLGLTASGIAMVILFILYGLYYGATEGSAKALVSDLVSDKHKGAAYGIYNMTTGFTVLFASVIAGYLWQTVSPASAFYLGSALSAVAAAGLVIVL